MSYNLSVIYIAVLPTLQKKIIMLNFIVLNCIIDDVLIPFIRKY